MSLLDDFANAFGHTIDSLAQDMGVATSDLEQIVNELAGFGIDVFSVANKVHFDPLTLLRNLVSLMNGDPHQAMISSMMAPFKPYEEPLYQLSQQWSQMAVLHQTTAQAIRQHMDELLSSSGNSSYSGPAATTLLNTHTSYQQFEYVSQTRDTQRWRPASQERGAIGARAGIRRLSPWFAVTTTATTSQR